MFIIKRKTPIICKVCQGTGKLKFLKKNTSLEDCIYDVRIKCKQKSIPLKNILKNKGNLIINQTNNKKVILFLISLFQILNILILRFIKA